MKLVNNCNKKLMDDELQEQIEASGMTLDEVLTLASIIQMEAANTDDMYRFRPSCTIVSKTVRSMISIRSTAIRPPIIRIARRTMCLRRSVIRLPVAYNTYTVRGLPAGPICNPGMDAIDAALNPQDTNYYYFCHDADGNAYYAATAAEHQQNLVEAGLR